VLIERVRGRAAAVLEPTMPDRLDEAVARVVELESGALILGSRQDRDAVEEGAPDRAGVDVVKRHSGGGAVLLQPGRFLWIDVLLPPTDGRWVDDVAVSFHWLGDLWAAALREMGRPSEVHRGPLEKTPWGTLVCFGAVGPGEVTVGGRKVVGFSQRRTRIGARFQCLVHDVWEPAELLALLHLTPAERSAAAADLEGRAAGAEGSLDELATAVVGRFTNW
jgi:lipoate-protein ligase A